MSWPFVVLFGIVALGVAAAAAAWWSFVVAQPDEWLLRIRDGKLVRSGIGISVWRRPGDLIVRFTSTMQRVGFTAEALTREGIDVLLEGCGGDHLRGLAEPRVDDLEALVTQSAREHLGSTIVAVEAGLGDEHLERSVGHDRDRSAVWP